MYIYTINYYICSYFIYQLSIAIDNRLSIATSLILTFEKFSFISQEPLMEFLTLLNLKSVW